MLLRIVETDLKQIAFHLVGHIVGEVETGPFWCLAHSNRRNTARDMLIY